MTTFYRCNGLDLFAGVITDVDISAWIESIKDHLQKPDDHVYTNADWCESHNETLVEVAPEALEIGQYLWNATTSVWDKVVPVVDLSKPLTDIMTLRENAYRTISDPLKFSIEEQAIINKVAPDYTPWIDSKAAIRAQFPKPVDADPPVDDQTPPATP